MINTMVYKSTSIFEDAIVFAITGINNMFQYIRKCRNVSQARRELYRFTDRELADIGISRSDIEWICRC